MIYNNAQEAFEFYYSYISKYGVNFNNTKALFNQSFEILNPLDNNIKTEWRNFSIKYAKRE